MAKNDPLAAAAFAFARGWQPVALALKAAATAIGTADTDAFRTITSDLSEGLRAQSIVGRLQGLRRVPFSTRLLRQTANTVAGWAGEKSPLPGAYGAYTETSTPPPLKVGALAVVTKDLMRSSDPSAEIEVARDLVRAGAEAMDSTFIDPANSGTSDVKPAAVSNGAATFSSSGAGVASIDSDLQALLAELTDHGSDLMAAAWVMRPRTSAYLAGLRGFGGSPCYPGVTARGGSLYGLPVLTSTALPEVGSPQESNICLIDAAQIALADDGEGDLSISANAAVELDTAPSGGAQALLSLWQEDLVGLRVLAYRNWSRRRPNAVAVLSGVAY